MELCLSLYADNKAQIIIKLDGLEGGVSIPEKNTEDEIEDSDHVEDDDDDESDPEEDSERTKDSEHEEGNNSEDEDNSCEECKKENFLDFVWRQRSSWIQNTE